MIHAAELKYKLNLNDWPDDVVAKMKKEVQELNSPPYSEEDLNIILKKLDFKMQFNSLKIVKIPNSDNEVKLIGEISAQVEKIDFNDLDEISESEALTLMNLTFKNALDEENLKAGADRLTQYYRDLGYRFAQVKYVIKSLSTIKKSILFTIDTKKQTKISELVVEGLDEKIKLEIEKKLRLLFSSRVMNQDTLNRVNISLRKELSSHGYFLTQVTSPQLVLSADELKAKVIYKLKNTTPYGIEILNIKQFPRLYIEDDILKLDSYYSKDSNFGAELVEKLKSFYISEGYPHIEIPFYERKEGSKIILTLNVEEGPFTRIARIKFVGQFSRDESFYRKKLLDLASDKINSSIYIKEDFEQAAKNLITFLQNEGFVSARLGRLQIATDREKPAEGTATLQLDEGPQISVGSIQIIGNKSIAQEKLLEITELKMGQRLSLVDLELALQNLKNYYNENGFIEYKLINEAKDLMTYSDQNTVAHIKFDIQEGPKVEVQSILIEGNDRTHDKLILTEIDFKQGDILTPSKIEESISRLQRTGHFSSTEITTLESGTNIPLRTVLIKVSERDPGVFTIGTGLTNENLGTVHGYTGIAYRNIGGWGRGVSARLEGNYNYADVRYLESKITLGAVEPYLLESRARLRLNLTRSRTISDYQIRKVTELNSTTTSIEQDFTSHLTGIWEILSVSTYVDRGITEEDEIRFGYDREDLVIASTGPTIDFDYRDNLFNPTKGSFTRFSVEYASESLGSFKVDDYYRVTGQTSWYFPFKDSAFVFAQSFRGGYIQDIKKNGFGIPYDKKGFLLGGRTTIRGFESDEFFPLTKTIGASYKLETSSSYELVKSELRFPLVNKWDLTGAVFYDGGQVLIKDVSFDDNWRDAVGIGIRYNTPVGPLNLEYAQKLDRKADESEGAFHLSIGVF